MFRHNYKLAFIRQVPNQNSVLVEDCFSKRQIFRAWRRNPDNLKLPSFQFSLFSLFTRKIFRDYKLKIHHESLSRFFTHSGVLVLNILKFDLCSFCCRFGGRNHLKMHIVLFFFPNTN